MSGGLSLHLCIIAGWTPDPLANLYRAQEQERRRWLRRPRHLRRHPALHAPCRGGNHQAIWVDADQEARRLHAIPLRRVRRRGTGQDGLVLANAVCRVERHTYLTVPYHTYTCLRVRRNVYLSKREMLRVHVYVCSM